MALPPPALPPPLQDIVDYLRVGYPDGVPEHDYIPLLALVSQRLSEEAGPVDDAEVARVRRKLESAGWTAPVAKK
jgi:hypothetical protein